MTTMTLESFDTQMLDYQNDLDFSMHVSSTDAWFQDEAAMEDDLHISHPHVPNVEVDMEPYEDHNEYEMEDGSELRQLHTNHILDVPFDGTPSSVDLQTTDTNLLSDPLDPIFTSPDLVKSSITDSDPHFLHTEHSDSPQSSHAPPVISLPSSKAEAFPSTPPFQYVDVADAGGHLPSSLLDPETDHSGVPLEPSSEVVGAEQYWLDQRDVDDAQNVGVDDENEIIPTPGGTEQLSDGGATSVENAPDVLRPLECQDIEYDGSAGDPHEISEGVYIDPPPAVLLSFTVARQPDISLFNTPPRDNGAPLTDDRPNFTVLLAHLPTLYYESISSVFEALRQEEYVDGILELLDSELVFDAHDLQLTISEDSIYAREISLHDLNVLHDGLNISGSLRLRIYTVSPRFIAQYRVLQEQVARFNATEFGETVVTPLSADHNDLLHVIQPKLANKVGAAEGQTGQHKDESFEGYLASAYDTADKLATQELEEQTRYDKDHHEQQDEHDEKGKSDPLTQLQDSTDHVSQKNEGQNGREAQTTDSKDTEHNANGEEQEDVEEEEEDAEEQDDVDEQVDEEQEDAPYVLGPTDNALFIPDKSIAPLEVNETAKIDPPGPIDNGDTEYEGYTEHDELGDDEYGKIPVNDNSMQGAVPIVPRGQSRTPHALDSTGTESASHVLEPVPDVKGVTGAESHHEVASSEYSQGPSTSDLSPATSKPDSNTSYDQTAINQYDTPEVLNPSTVDDEAWDDDPDGGDEDPDTTWEAEHETESNQSSVTLSSKMSSKRSISEIELEQDDDQTPSSPTSPGPKRLRVE